MLKSIFDNNVDSHTYYDYFITRLNKEYHNQEVSIEKTAMLILVI